MDTLEVKKTPLHKVWGNMEEMVKSGLTKSIGVSNCTIPLLLNILADCEIKPVTNQVECHPFFVQKNFVDFHNKFQVPITAYAPIGSGTWNLRGEHLKNVNVLTEPLVKDLAQKYGKSPAQIVLNWHLHMKHIVIPKTAKVERLSENFLCYDFTLTDEEYNQITKLDKEARLFNPVHIQEIGWNNLPYFE